MQIFCLHRQMPIFMLYISNITTNKNISPLHFRKETTSEHHIVRVQETKNTQRHQYYIMQTQISQVKELK